MTTAIKNDATIDHALLGAWRLVSFYIDTSNNEREYPFGETPQGILIYTDSGYMSAQLMRPDRPLFEGSDQLNGTRREIEENFKGCVSYFGRYELNYKDSYVLHHVDQSLFPNWEGGTQKRLYTLDSDRLVISTPPMIWGGVDRVAVLEWRRA